MATEALKSALLTNKDASPTVYSNADADGGKVQVVFATDETAGGDAGSTYRMVRLPSHARVLRVELAADDLSASGATLDVGLWDVAAGALEDADFFASAVDVATAAVARTDVTYESGVIDIANAGKMIWEQLGLSADPGTDFDVYLTSGTAATTGTVSVWVEYVTNDQ